MYEQNNLMITFCPSEGSVLVSTPVAESLGFPKHLQMLINEEKRMFLIRSCDIDDTDAVVLPQMQLNQFEIGAKNAIKRLQKLTGWSTEPMAVCGQYITEFNAVLFALDEARPVQLQPFNIGG